MSSDAEAAFAALAERFESEPDVSPGTGFGTARGLRADGQDLRDAAPRSAGREAAAERCAAIVAAGGGDLFVVGRRTMREWLVIDGVDDDAWAELAAEALAYVRG